MQDPDIQLEPVIGHVVAARLRPPTRLSGTLDALAEELDIDRRSHEVVEIEVGDVDWDETKRIPIGREALLEIADYYRE